MGRGARPRGLVFKKVISCKPETLSANRRTLKIWVEELSCGHLVRHLQNPYGASKRRCLACESTD
jgi:hypothetical protein